ncbi:MAG: phage holin family protein [Candidatus Nealsonbacteria bacterium]|nr:phage holin family protein [Candidatus Nealsonbacteria bacterium]
MMNLALQLVAGVASLWLADKFVTGVEITGGIQFLFIIGAILGLINFFVQPLLKTITLPLRILTLGLFGFIINMVIVWMADILFPELIIPGLIPLFWTTAIFTILNLILVK